jgi:hypothetical protein
MNYCYALQARLDSSTAELAKGSPVVCLFVNDDCNAKVNSRTAILPVSASCQGFICSAHPS